MATIYVYETHLVVCAENGIPVCAYKPDELSGVIRQLMAEGIAYRVSLE